MCRAAGRPDRAGKLRNCFRGHVQCFIGKSLPTALASQFACEKAGKERYEKHGDCHLGALEEVLRYYTAEKPGARLATKVWHLSGTPDGVMRW